jgi:hypothetical protein
VGKIIITGPGRSGTSFLVQLLTRLGFDTGFQPGQEGYSEATRAGCEHRLTVSIAGGYIDREAIDNAPRILKSPAWSLALKGFVQYGGMEVDHVFIPVRDLDMAAASRLDAGLDWMVMQTDDLEAKRQDQASVIAMVLGRAVEACEVCDIPYTIMHFPRLVKDAAYCRKKLGEGLDMEGKDFENVFAELANPAQVKWR